MADAPAASGVAARMTGASVARNTIINAVAIFSGLLVTLLVTPYIVHQVGSNAFGVWALALTLTVSAGYLSLTDLGLQQTAVRFLADAHRTQDAAALRGIFSTTLALFVGVSAAVAALLIVVAPLLAAVFNLPARLEDDATLVFRIIALQAAFDLPALAFRAVLEASQRFGAVRAIDVGRNVLFAGIVVVLLGTGGGVVSVALASVVAAVLALACYAAVAVATEPTARFRPRTIERTRTRKMLRFSGWLFVIRILSVTYRQMDKVILAVVLTVQAVAVYEISNRLATAVILLAGATGGALLPAAAYARLDTARLRELFLRGTTYSAAIVIPVAVTGIVYAKLLVVGWVGDELESATGPARLFFVWVALGAFDAVGTTMLVSVGRLRPMFWLTLVWVATNLGLSIALAPVWGVSGVVAATVVTYVPLLAAYTAICLREFAIPVREWLRRVVAPNVPGPALQLALGMATLPLVERLPPLAGAALGGVAGIALSIGTYLLVIGRPGRAALARTLLATRRSSGPEAAERDERSPATM